MGEQHHKMVSEKIPVYNNFLRGFFIMKVIALKTHHFQKFS